MKRFVTFSVLCFVLVSAQSLPTMDSYKRSYRNYYPTPNRNTRQWSGVRYPSTNDYLSPPLYTNAYSYFSKATNPLTFEGLYRGLGGYGDLGYGDLGYGSLRHADLGYGGLGGYIGLRGLGIGGLQGYAGLYGIQGLGGLHRNYGDLRTAYGGPESLYRRRLNGIYGGYGMYGAPGLRSLYNRVGGLGIRELWAPTGIYGTSRFVSGW